MIETSRRKPSIQHESSYLFTNMGVLDSFMNETSNNIITKFLFSHYTSIVLCLYIYPSLSFGVLFYFSHGS